MRDVLLSIITINYNGFKDTCAMIDSLPSCAVPMEVVVVDNGSANDEASALAARYPDAIIVRSTDNLGFAGGNNLGIAAAHGRYLYFVNNDTVFRSDAHIERLIDRLEASPKTGMVCPKIRFTWDDSPLQFAGYTPLSPITLRNHSIGYGEADKGQYDTPHPTPYAHGAAMMVKREAIDRAGRMPECYFLYYEELDWSLMITRAGYDIRYEPASTLYHKESQATGKDSPTKTYYLSRNRLLFARRNLSGLTRMLSYCYLAGVVGLRDTLKHYLHRRPDLAKATLSGIAHFLKS